MKKTILILAAVIAIVAGSTAAVSALVNMYMPATASGFTEAEQDKLGAFFGGEGASFAYIFTEGSDVLGADMIFPGKNDGEIMALFAPEEDWRDFTGSVRTPEGDIVPLKKLNLLNRTLYFYKNENRARVYAVVTDASGAEDFYAIFEANR